MTHDIIGQQLDEALQLVEPSEEPSAKEMREVSDDYAEREMVSNLIRKHGVVKASLKLSLILEEESRKVTFHA
jgi:hypothetical protein